jgi:cyclohexadienyl dehydratase
MKKFIGAALLAGLALVSLAQQSALADDGAPSRLDQVLKSGKLRVCMTGDYKPFTFYRPDRSFEGMDVELAQSLAKSLGVEAQFIKTSWSKLMDDFIAQCDIGMGGVSITLDRQKKAAFSTPTMVDGKAPLVRCADKEKFRDFDTIDQPGTRAIVNPGGTNERFARSRYQRATLMLYPDNVTIFQQIVDGRADVMVTDASETMWQAKLHPELCPVNPERPLQFAEKAYLLPRGDVAFKEYVDAWLHLAKATGEYQQVFDKWLK